LPAGCQNSSTGMILLVHLLFGAAIGSAIKNIPLALILAFLSHYLLDVLPHTEYNIENIREKQWQKAMSDFLKILLDFCSGILLIALFVHPLTSSGQLVIYVCAFLAILPDGFTILHSLIPIKILKIHHKIHIEKIHFLKHKKISNFWRIFSQIAVVIISIMLFNF